MENVSLLILISMLGILITLVFPILMIFGDDLIKLPKTIATKVADLIDGYINKDIDHLPILKD